MKKTALFYLASFTIPLTILSICLSFFNIWPGSPTTILASDGFHQYVIFAQTLRDILHGKDSIFYTFTSGLGANFYALISYYLGSFLSPLVYFFDLTTMPDALYLMTLVKIGLIGLSTFTSLSLIYKKLDSWLTLVLSSSFALMSFSISQIEINMWLDVFSLLPMIILGLHRLTRKKSYWLYFTSLSILFIQNYYFGYMTAIFISLWFLVDLVWQPKQVLRKFIDFTVLSICSGLTAAIMLLPTYLDLKTHGESFTEVSKLLTDNSWYLDIFAKTMVASYDTTQFNAIPIIYVGLFPLIIASLFFFIKSISWPVKLAHGLLLGIIIASFYLEALDLFWQGMHAPNMFLHRYAWVFSLTITYMAGASLERARDIKLPAIFTVTIFWGMGYLATFVFRDQYDFLKLEQFALTACFLLAYLIILASWYSKQIDKKLYTIFTVFFVLLELSLNSYYQLDGLDKEWHFPSREGYASHLTEIDKLVKNNLAGIDSFYRTERLLPQTGNDSMKYGYNGISQFSSVRNRKSSQVLDKLGFRSDGTNLNLRYQNNTLIADSLFAVAYNLHQGIIDKYGFDWQDQQGETSLYHNRLASQIALLTENPYQELTFSINTLDNQANLLNQLSGLKQTYFRRLLSYYPEHEKELTTKPKEDGSSSITLTIEALAKHQAYLSLPKLTGHDQSDTVRLNINGQEREYTTDNAFTLFDLGYHPEETTLTVEIIFPDSQEVRFKQPNSYGLDVEAYERAMTAINSRAVTARTKGNQLLIDYDSPSDASLFITLPYDKGWTAKRDGQTIPIKPAQGGLMLLDAPAGSGQIIMTFVPHGLLLGSGLSLLGLLTFLAFQLMRQKQANT